MSGNTYAHWTQSMRHTHLGCNCLAVTKILAFDFSDVNLFEIGIFLRWPNVKYAKYMINTTDVIIIALLKEPTLTCRLERYLPGFIINESIPLPKEIELPDPIDIIEVGSYDEPTFSFHCCNKL